MLDTKRVSRNVWGGWSSDKDTKSEVIQARPKVTGVQVLIELHPQ